MFSGTHKNRDGKVVQVYRKKYVIHIERISREKNNGEWDTRAQKFCVDASLAPYRPYVTRTRAARLCTSVAGARTVL